MSTKEEPVSIRHMFGSRLKECRNEQGITQAELAQHCLVGRDTISKIEQGLHSPRVTTVHAILEVLGDKYLDYLMGLTHEKPAVLNPDPEESPPQPEPAKPGTAVPV